MSAPDTPFTPMADQALILDTYRQGRCAILATPGSGKTTLISHLIVRLIHEQCVAPTNILVLTFTDSAAQEFENRTQPLLAQQGIRKSPEFATIHSFCYRLLRQFKPEYSEREVIPEEKKYSLFESLLSRYSLPSSPAEYVPLFVNQLLPLSRLYSFSSLPLQDIQRLTGYARSSHLFFFKHLDEILQAYEAHLDQENCLDYDMMIIKACEVLRTQPVTLQLLRDQYTHVIEDEAQDSTPAQAAVLELLAGEGGNWLRVGDPNQSIYSFTGADFTHLRQFSMLHTSYPMRESNRSSPQIIALANHLQERYASAFPSSFPIRPGPLNPANGWIWIKDYRDIEQEVEALVKAIRSIQTPERSLAVLCRTNQLCQYVSRQLKEFGVEHVLHRDWEDDFFKADVVVLLESVLDFLLQPSHFQLLRQLLMRLGFAPDLIHCFFDIDTPLKETLPKVAQGTLFHPKAPPAEAARLAQACRELLFLIGHIYCPVSQLLEWIGQRLLQSPAERAQLRFLHQLWLKTGPRQSLQSLETFRQWMKRAGRWKIRQSMASLETSLQFTSPGPVHVLTAHKSKGLQWDGVFLPFFAYGRAFQSTAEELKAVLKALKHQRSFTTVQTELRADSEAESIRLAYVGITRARQFLSMTWCATKDSKIGLYDDQPTDVFLALRDYYKGVAKLGKR